MRKLKKVEEIDTKKKEIERKNIEGIEKNMWKWEKTFLSNSSII